jgi:hypothetical protein
VLGDAGAGGDATVTAGDAGDAAGALLYCQPASPTDMVKNDSETDVDCGGALLASGMPNPASDGAPVCTHGMACLLGVDCDQGVCNANMDMGGGPIDCPAGATCACQIPWPNDGVKNDSETDVDCGGTTALGSDGAPPCAPGLHCNVGPDCTSAICGTDGLCTVPTPTDGVKNGGETATDCGGSVPPVASCVPTATADCAPPCADAVACLADTDCLSGFCSVNTKLCVDGQSCKALVTPAAIMDPNGMTDMNGDALGTPDPNGAGQSAGLDTCGAGESTDAVANQHHESCCKSLLLPGSVPVHGLRPRAERLASA